MIEALGITREESAEALTKVGQRGTAEGNERRIMRALELAPTGHPNRRAAPVYAKALFRIMAETGSLAVARMAAHAAAVEQVDADWHERPSEWERAADEAAARHSR